MAFSAERLLAHTFPEIRHSYGERDAILYALGIGLGADPLVARAIVERAAEAAAAEHRQSAAFVS
jgi:hypothetical protein